ncbi:hypothetical protein N7G274_000862 [Stereocaulon virgatum]|uniref:Uncharacterized protein n=1 Tax=Stereocaulon virgatum TaxID=373712 RepID=A0ABR4AM79_9LECA
MDGPPPIHAGTLHLKSIIVRFERSRRVLYKAQPHGSVRRRPGAITSIRLKTERNAFADYMFESFSCMNLPWRTRKVDLGLCGLSTRQLPCAVPLMNSFLVKSSVEIPQLKDKDGSHGRRPLRG